jgi:hypothetical protein
MQNLKVYRIKHHGVKGQLGEENIYAARGVDNIGIRLFMGNFKIMLESKLKKNF